MSNSRYEAELTRLQIELVTQIPYEDTTPAPIVLDPRPRQQGYVRPPMEDQTFVPEIHHLV